jgi:N-acetyl-gamma-glutamyl-phosphate reductase
MHSTNQARVAVVGATGYGGAELVRLLVGHPGANVTFATSEKDAGKPLGAVHPYLACAGLDLRKADPKAIAAESDFAFVALPHGTSTPIVRALVADGVRVVDLGADFRFSDRDLYEKWYGEHGAPELLTQAAYGLTEFARETVAAANLVANPGCYPTGALLALIPVAERITGPVFVDSKSGTSGAGRAASTPQLFAEITENLRPYSVWKHRHQPEIEAQLAARGGEVPVRFSPHLLPIARGLSTACYVGLSDTSGLDELFAAAYGDEPFVRVLGPGAMPEPRNVRGTNFTDIGWVVDEQTGTAAIYSAIDNLGKGAAGQAVQNMNCMLGFAESDGLGHLVAALP